MASFGDAYCPSPAQKGAFSSSKHPLLSCCIHYSNAYTISPLSFPGAPQGKLIADPTAFPTVRRDDQVIDSMHGVNIPDPYRWLEDPDSDETKAFVDAQNALSNSFFDQCTSRPKFKSLFEQLFNYERHGLVFRKGNRYYYSHNTGLQAQNVIYTLNSLDDPEPKLFIDPNTLSEDGTVALMQYAFSDDGNYVAMATSSGGSDWRTVTVSKINQETGERTQLPDVLNNVKFTSLSWTHDNLGFFYNSYTPPSTTDAGTETDKNQNQQLRYHIIGQLDQSKDATVLAIPEEPDWMIGSSVSHDGKHLILSVSAGCEPTNRMWIVNLEKDIPKSGEDNGSGGALDFSSFDFHTGTAPLPLNKVIDNFNASWDYIGSNEETGKWVLQTNLNAQRYKLVHGTTGGLDASSSPETWEELIPEHPKDVLQWASRLKGDFMVTCYLKDVKSSLQLRKFSTGEVIKELELPGIGSVGGFSGSRKQSEFFFSFTSFTEPGAQYRVEDPSNPSPVLFRRVSVKFEPEEFETKQVFVPSKNDGTLVPMFLIHRKGKKFTKGDDPVLLYGYGGFNISLEPSFSISRMCWLLAYDGVMAIANLRGGGEYGTGWRDDGSRSKKQNVFDDFISCAEYLHNEKISTPATLAIQGGSNGGLLVAACINQRPDLFQVGLAQVGVLDGIRFKRFTIGHAWCTDYGDVDVEEEFGWIVKWSPLHNVTVPVQGNTDDDSTGQYPAILLTTGSHDDRVVPLHTHKFLAQLQYVLGNGGQRNPLLARVEVRAGHGAGKPTKKIIEETSDMLSFAAEVMGAEWKYNGPLEIKSEEEDAGKAAAA
jgi:prolyl oligopeptidase